MKSFSAIAAAAILSGADARMWFGACPAADWQTIDHAALAGNWYEQKRDNWMTMDMGQSCSTGTYRLRADGRLDVQWRAKAAMMMYQYGQSPVMQMDCSAGPGCDISNEDKTPEQQAESAAKRANSDWQFGILASDYQNWHVMYGCGQMCEPSDRCNGSASWVERRESPTSTFKKP